jgi:hypothetical protein
MAMTCPDCGSAMEAGFVVDHGESEMPRVASWVEGAPEDAKFLGMKVGIKLKGRRKIPIGALRCTRCGLLKLYAMNQT